MQWFKPHHEKPLRQQLLEARDNLRSQIDLLSAGSAYGTLSGDYKNAQAQELKAMLEEIEAELRRHKDDHAKGS
jgi:hypothetical protein